MAKTAPFVPPHPAPMQMPSQWTPEQKLFPHQVGFTCPPFDYCAAPSDFLRMARFRRLMVVVEPGYLSSTAS